MITKAGKQAIQTFTTWTKVNDTRNAVPMFPNDSIRNVNNNECWMSLVDGNLLSNNQVQSYAGWDGIQIGSGSTAATENDYALANQITSDFTGTISYTERGIDNGSLYMEFGVLITNTGSSNMTIAEIGLVTSSTHVCDSSSGTSVFNTNILIDRTLLASAITIAPLETKLIKYRITSSMSFS